MRRGYGWACLVVVGAAFVASPLKAEVVTSGPNGFTLQQTRQIALKPAEAWARFVAVGQWWAPDHTWSGSAENLSLIPKAGGCFCERWSGGEAEHLRVVFAEPGKTLRMAGALGPLQMSGMSGNMAVTFTPKGEGTEVTLRYAIFGHAEPDLAAWSGPVDGVLSLQMTRYQTLPAAGQSAKTTKP